MIGIPGPVPVIVDTGFTGELCLSRKHTAGLHLRRAGVEWYELGDGSRVAEVVYALEVVWFGVVRDVAATLTDSADSMVGAQLLQDCAVPFLYSKGSFAIYGPGEPAPPAP